jgi:hypothetical protein
MPSNPAQNGDRVLARPLLKRVIEGRRRLDRPQRPPRKDLAMTTKPMTSSSSTPPARKRRRFAQAVLALPVLLTAGSAAAFIVAVVPAVVKIPAPPSVVPGALVGPNIQAFDERQDVVLPFNVAVDARPINPGIQLPGDLNPGVIPAGTCVRSHYLHYEPLSPATATGSADFSDDILGVEVRQASLDATNFLGNPFTAYPVAAQCLGGPANHQCGMELLPEDSLRVGQRRVEVSFYALAPGDRIRVITRSCGCDWQNR